jgi:hypothetical protein
VGDVLPNGNLTVMTGRAGALVWTAWIPRSIGATGTGCGAEARVAAVCLRGLGGGSEAGGRCESSIVVSGFALISPAASAAKSIIPELWLLSSAESPEGSGVVASFATSWKLIRSFNLDSVLITLCPLAASVVSRVRKLGIRRT